MKKLFIALVAIASFASCKKESITTVSPPPSETMFSKNVKTISTVSPGNPTEIANYSFDAQGRITSSIEEYPGSVKEHSFDYTTAGKILGVRKSNGVINSIYDCTVNNEGYIITNIIKNGAGTLIATYNYTYDANGYITKVAWTNPAGVTDHSDYKIEGGNLTEKKLYYNGVLNNTTTYSYDLTKNNCLKYSQGGNWGGVSFGKATKNIVTNIKVTNPSGVVTWESNYTYLIDAAGYIQKQNQTILMTGFTSESTYTYQ